MYAVSGAFAAYWVFVGSLFPDVDTVFGTRLHRSWITHTAFVPAVMAFLAGWKPVLFSGFDAVIPFFTLGIAIHLLIDFLGPEVKHEGERMPLRPILFNGPKWLTAAASVAPQVPFILHNITNHL